MSVSPYPSKTTEKPDEEAPAGVGAWMAGAPMPRQILLVVGFVLPAVLLATNMWRVREYTVDDAFISYRYARNLARGLGLVYNAGEHVEGYTNFLFTVILAGGIKIGLDPERLSKLIGGAAAFGSLWLTQAISGRILPYKTLPCVATWLLASSIVFSGWSIFGLETGVFVFLILLGTYLFLRETDDDAPPATGLSHDGAASGPKPRAPAEPNAWLRQFPWSGVSFMLAGLTRPEAPMFLGLLMIALLCARPAGPGTPAWLRPIAFVPGRIFSKQNLLRGAVFAVPIMEHLAFRWRYYGGLVPNTALAKTGNLQQQIQGGLNYIENYAQHAGPVLYLALLGLGYGIMRRRREVIALAIIAVAVLAYVVVVGGDWMKFFRFMAPFEPFCFLLVDIGVRRAVDKRDGATNLALGMFALMTVVFRTGAIREAQVDFLTKEKTFWDTAAGGTANWLLQHDKPGELALGDIGYVGWATDYPILDLLGLVDPVISKLPGGYTQKVGFVDRLFEKKPRYVLIISSNIDCVHPSVTGSIAIFNDRRFRPQYQISGKVPLKDGFAWCVYERK